MFRVSSLNFHAKLLADVSVKLFSLRKLLFPSLSHTFIQLSHKTYKEIRTWKCSFKNNMPYASSKSINIQFATIMNIFNKLQQCIVIFLNEISSKGQIIITVPMQEKLQIEFIAIFAINPFPFITVICEYIYQHMNADVSFKFNMWTYEKQVSMMMMTMIMQIMMTM